MAEINYAFIKNGEVTNIAVFEDPTDAQLLAHFQNEFSLDNIVKATDKAIIGGTYDGAKFWFPQPYSSWIKDQELNQWVAPSAMPVDDNVYEWDETTLSWIMVPLIQ